MKLEIYFVCLIASFIGNIRQIAGQGVCSDQFGKEECNSYMQNNNCGIVESYCALTCGFCANNVVPYHASAHVCTDSSTECVNWANSGHCQTSKDVRNFCPVSCNTCGGSFTPVAGLWDEWGGFGPCSVACGYGTRERFRSCPDTYCAGSSSSTEPCYINCDFETWGQWQPFGSCDVTCGTGQRTRYRDCPIQNCIGSSSSSEVCTLGPCSACIDDPVCSTIVPFSLAFCASPIILNSCPQSCQQCAVFFSPAYGKLSPWSKFGPCSKACGPGTRTRKRTCDGILCLGKLKSTQNCNIKPCSTKTPKWGPWSKFTQCSVKCGGGTRTKRRVCKGGSSCSGSSSKTEKCNTPRCKGSWGRWSDYTRCSKTCGGGTKTRTRKCQAFFCIGKNFDKAKCNVQKCKVKVGVWAQWGAFSKCSKICGIGTKTRRRYCQSSKCSGISKETKNCKLRPCTKPTPKGWGAWSAYSKCTKSCGGGTRVRRRVCKGGKCTGISKQTMKCNVESCSGKGNGWNNWSKYGPCSKRCGGGTRTRTRVCGIANCLGANKQTQQCNTDSCRNPQPDGWSACTKSCGVGTRYKFDKSSCRSADNPNCLRSYQECNTGPCPKATCRYDEKLRYGMDYSCCYSGSQRRIIGGSNARIEDWPWMALIHTPLICGGSLIHAQWVVSAAHCFDGLSVTQRIHSEVHVGIQRYSERKNRKSREVQKVVLHPNYKMTNLENDISLIQLKKPVILNSRTRPVSLPYTEETPIDTTCQTAGWGFVDASREEPSEDLLQVGLHIFDSGLCRKRYASDLNVPKPNKEFVMRTKNLLCAGSLTRNSDTCNGDSGGPLICQRCKSCEWYLAGITSFGPPYKCGEKGYPAMYTKVKKFEEWIYSHINALKKPPHKCPYAIGP